ncbi:MAG: DUF58 domain-containing protein [Chloroflexi bacterium]|nr:DUF58 domain-containing protein [Chloroflexota bacterium]
MTGTAFAAILLLLAGTFLNVPVAVILAIVVLLLEIVRAVWTRYGLERVVYRRHLERDRITWGEEIATTIEVWNRKSLPLAWLRAEDEASQGVTIRERPLVIGGRGGRVLRNAWTLAPHERVTRHFHVSAERRGVYELGPVRLSVGDLFAREAASEDRAKIDRFLVRPRTVPTTALHRRDTWGGQDRARAGLTEDPSRFAGVREYAPGDPIRRIHPRASARLGRPVVKRFEPSRDREVLLAVDVQIAAGPIWESPADSDEVEALFVVAASLARSLALERAAFGLAAAGYHGAESRFAHLPVSEAPGQLERVFDLLARLSSHPSAPFDRLLGMITRVVRPGTTVVVLTARDPSSYLAWLRRLERAGCRVVVVACGPNGPTDAGRARQAGLVARAARLDGPWRTAAGVAVGG